MNKSLSFIAILVLAGGLALSPLPQAGGNVQVSVVNGSLVVRGDDQDNNIIFTETNIAGRAGTTINGQRSIFVPEGVTGDVIINLRGGDDFVRVELPGTNFAIPQDLEINTGAGTDTIELLQVRAPEETRIDTGNGNDIVFIDGVFNGNEFIRSEFTGKFKVDTSSGEDLLEFHHAIFRGAVDVKLGSGIDGACSTQDSEFLLPDQASFNGGSPSAFPGDGFVAPSIQLTHVTGFEFDPDDCSFLGGRF
jgi:hypothetical protein